MSAERRDELAANLAAVEQRIDALDPGERVGAHPNDLNIGAPD